MSEPSHELERLISRHLDGECSPRERRLLNARLRRDPAARALFEGHRALDHEIKHALRSEFGRPSAGRRPVPRWERAARVCALAAAACLMVMLWLNPARDASEHRGQTPSQARSWFGSLPTAGDSFIERPARYDRPQIKVGKPDTDWIVIPSNTPGEYLVIEVNHVLTRTVHIQQDF